MLLKQLHHLSISLLWQNRTLENDVLATISMTLTTIGDENETLFDSIYSKFQTIPLPPRNSLSTGAKVHWGNNNEAMECCREINATATGDRPCTLATTNGFHFGTTDINPLKELPITRCIEPQSKVFSKNNTKTCGGQIFQCDLTPSPKVLWHLLSSLWTASSVPHPWLRPQPQNARHGWPRNRFP